MKVALSCSCKGVVWAGDMAHIEKTGSAYRIFGSWRRKWRANVM
jgi:hypothetical protein